MNLRFSLLGLIGFTTFAALASAALVQPGIGWTSLIVSLTGTLLCWQVLRAILTSGESRAAAAGWLLFTFGYLALAIGPWLGGHVGPHLLSSRGLNYAQFHWRHEDPTAGGVPIQQWYDLNGRININTINDGTGGLVLLDSGWVSYPAAGTTFDPPAPAIHFQLAGHWLFAWLAGWLGAVLAVQFQRRRGVTRRSIECNKKYSVLNLTAADSRESLRLVCYSIPRYNPPAAEPADESLA